MKQFLALIKLENRPTPLKLEYEAKEVGDAITVMLDKLNMRSTLGIDEFEILMLIDNNHYGRVAVKNKMENRVVNRVVDNVVPQPKPVSTALVGPLVTTEVAEKTYTPYTVKVA